MLHHIRQAIVGLHEDLNYKYRFVGKLRAILLRNAENFDCNYVFVITDGSTRELNFMLATMTATHIIHDKHIGLYDDFPEELRDWNKSFEKRLLNKLNCLYVFFFII